MLTHSIVLLSVGGALGVNARYWLGVWFKQQAWAADWPWATFVINVLGSALLGMVVVLTAQPERRPWLLLFGTGLCGGFTTFSAFSVETLELLERGEWLRAGLYVVGSVTASLSAAALALALTRWLTAQAPPA
jgi:CrcB protein